MWWARHRTQDIYCMTLEVTNLLWILCRPPSHATLDGKLLLRSGVIILISRKMIWIAFLGFDFFFFVFVFQVIWWSTPFTSWLHCWWCMWLLFRYNMKKPWSCCLTSASSCKCMWQAQRRGSTHTSNHISVVYFYFLKIIFEKCSVQLCRFSVTFMAKIAWEGFIVVS